MQCRLALRAQCLSPCAGTNEGVVSAHALRQALRELNIELTTEQILDLISTMGTDNLNRPAGTVTSTSRHGNDDDGGGGEPAVTSLAAPAPHAIHSIDCIEFARLLVPRQSRAARRTLSLLREELLRLNLDLRTILRSFDPGGGGTIRWAGCHLLPTIASAPLAGLHC